MKPMSNRRHRPSLGFFFIMNMVLVVVLALVSLNLIWVYEEYSRFKEDGELFRKSYVASQKNLIKSQVDTLHSHIRHMREQTEQRLRRALRDRVGEAYRVIDQIHQRSKGSKPDPEITEMIKDILRPIRFSNGRGSFFAFDSSGLVVLYPDRPDLEGKHLAASPDGQPEVVVQSLIDLVKAQGQGFHQCKWAKPGNGKQPVEMLAYVQRFEPLDLIIGTGEYLDVIRDQAQNYVLKEISQLRDGRDGYFFGSTFDGRPLFSGGKVTRGGSSIWDLTDPDGIKLIREQSRAAQRPEGGYVAYSWRKLGEEVPTPKISYVRGLPGWGWTIGTGVYLDDLTEQINVREKAMGDRFRALVAKSLIALAVILALILLWSNRFARRVGRSLTSFTSFFQEAATESKPIAKDELFFREFDQIADSANRMIEARQAAEEALRVSEERFKIAIEGSQDGLWDWNLETNEAFHSDQFAKMLGYQPGDLPFTSEAWSDLLHPDDKEGAFKAVEEYLNDLSGTYRSVFRMRTKDGDYRWIVGRGRAMTDETGKPVRLVGFNTDITERKLAEEALADSERRYRHMFEDSPLPQFIQDFSAAKTRMDELVESGVTDLRVYLDANREELARLTSLVKNIFANPATADLYEIAEGVPANLTAVLPEKIEDHYIDQLVDLYQGLGRWEGVTQNVTARGNILDVLIRKVVVPGHEEDLSRVLTSAVDLTPIKAAQREKDRLEAQLRQAHKMEAIGTLAGGIAHDFNNILAAILGYAELGLDSLEPDEPVARNLVRIRQSALRARDLVRQILSFSRSTDHEMKPIILGPIIQEALTLLRATVPTTIEIESDLEEKTDPVAADPVQIHQVVLNLCGNAADAMKGSGGTLRVALKNAQIDGDPVSDRITLEPGPYVRITVEDTGPGIQPGVIDRIFDPFFTTKEVGSGTGMGLSVVHGIVKNHGGEVDVESLLGHGAVFRVYLPAADGPDVELVPDTPLPKPGAGESILLVDDEDLLAEMAGEMLSSLGYRTTVATSSQEAWATFEAAPDSFDLVITDMAMPRMNGAQLSRRILDLRPDQPIIMCTGYSDQMDEAEARRIGVRHLLMKPFSVSDLSRVLRLVMAA